MKRPNKLHHIEAHDECGNLVYFEMPRAAILFGTETVSDQDEKRIRAKQLKLACEYCALADKRQRAFMGLSGKIKYVNRLQAKGVWV